MSDVTEDGGIGNFTNASVCGCGVGENSMPRSGVPIEYCRTYFAAVT